MDGIGSPIPPESLENQCNLEKYKENQKKEWFLPIITLTTFKLKDFKLSQDLLRKKIKIGKENNTKKFLFVSDIHKKRKRENKETNQNVKSVLKEGDIIKPDEPDWNCIRGNQKSRKHY